MEEAQVDALIDDLESSAEWRADVGEVVRGLLAGLPATPVTDVQRARLTLLGCKDLTPGSDAAVAAVVILGVRDRAAADGHRGVQVRAERALSALLRDVGDPAAAMQHAVAAMALDGEDLDPATRCRVRIAMADALAVRRSFDDARHRYREAFERARSMSTPWLSLVVLNNWAYTELLADRLGAAAELVEQVRAIAQQHGTTLNLVTAGTVAEILHALGRSDEAVSMLREHLLAGGSDTVVVAGCWLVLAQMQRDVGDLDAADASLSTAERLSATHGLHGLRVEGIGSRAELLAARGDHAGAYEVQCTFHAETLALRSAAAEARAQTQHAMLQADTARRESARYRTLSYRDPLTGLLNRRHVDEDLDHRLTRGSATTPALAIAMLDLDHFKRVNDTCSHEAGDAVLVRLAALLTEAATGGYAARLGGEEFLLVLPDHDLLAAHAVAEALRRRIADQDWTDIAPSVPITASIGLAIAPDTVRPSLDRAGLLRRADDCVYAAKTRGRNRVEPPIAAPEAQARAGP